MNLLLEGACPSWNCQMSFPPSPFLWLLIWKQYCTSVHAIIPKLKEKFRKTGVVVCCIIQKLEEIKSVCARHEAYKGSRGLVPLILYLSTRCRWVVSLMPRPHFRQGRTLPYPLNRRLGRSQSRPRLLERGNVLPFQEIELNVQPILSSLYRLWYHILHYIYVFSQYGCITVPRLRIQNCASLASVSQVHPSAMLLPLIVGKYVIWVHTVP